MALLATIFGGPVAWALGSTESWEDVGDSVDAIFWRIVLFITLGVVLLVGGLYVLARCGVFAVFGDIAKTIVKTWSEAVGALLKLVPGLI